eukprot:CAMPEP_0179233426 /NCGR_PEP_ID=MMETSP0797-20121207/12367_1 /TAXON_ID=47934 /ORGANISM="Dinophysis acuminata, Strain DAEP01" /LENGTH=129 /DNA_ID=CAMNT_0020940573 /DNA_START=29 /DNA_END=414 /DNA_ORIENTATION=-
MRWPGVESTACSPAATQELIDGSSGTMWEMVWESKHMDMCMCITCSKRAGVRGTPAVAAVPSPRRRRRRQVLVILRVGARGGGIGRLRKPLVGGRRALPVLGPRVCCHGQAHCDDHGGNAQSGRPGWRR